MCGVGKKATFIQQKPSLAGGEWGARSKPGERGVEDKSTRGDCESTRGRNAEWLKPYSGIRLPGAFQPQVHRLPTEMQRKNLHGRQRLTQWNEFLMEPFKSTAMS